MAAVRPLSDCAKTKDGSGMWAWSAVDVSSAGCLRIGGGRPGPLQPALVHELCRIDVGRGLHDWKWELRVLHRLAVELAAIGLVVLVADGEWTDRGLHGQTEQRLADLVGVRGTGLLDGLGQELHADVPLDRPGRRVLVL